MRFSSSTLISLVAVASLARAGTASTSTSQHVDDKDAVAAANRRHLGKNKKTKHKTKYPMENTHPSKGSKKSKKSKGGSGGSHSKSKGKKCKKLEPLPINEHDFHEPDWEAIIEGAFPVWDAPEEGCARLDKVDGDLLAPWDTFSAPEDDKFNPCYYTKAFAGLDPEKGGYPSPIDTHYPYEFAAPFIGQPGDGSVHHCPLGSETGIDIGGCPKLQQCPDGVKDCATISDEYGIGHIPPFVPLAAIKNAYNSCSVKHLCSEWFDYDTNGCNIKKCALDELVVDQFGTTLDDETVIKFEPPILLDGKPSNTYYRLEYGGEEPACTTEGICKGPHYCSKAAGAKDSNIWGDFCPYVHTGENAGKYRHPHIALAALELYIAHQCMPHQCPLTWLDSPNGKDYQTDPMKSTTITWAEMEDNNFPISQPKVGYEWPNKDGLDGDHIFPSLDLYDGKMVKPAPGMYINEIVAA